MKLFMRFKVCSSPWRQSLKVPIVAIASMLFIVSTLGAQTVRHRVPPSSFETVAIMYTANSRGLHAATQTQTPASAQQTIITALRKEYKDILLVDLGNFMGATPTTYLTKGEFDFQIMELLGYNLLHISVDEFIDGVESLKQRVANTKIPVLAGNMSIIGSTAVKWSILPCGNRKIGFIGVTSLLFPTLVMDDMREGVVLDTARDYIFESIRQMAGHADIVVALTDLTEDEAYRLRNINGLDLIITTGGDALKNDSDWLSVGFPGGGLAAVARTYSQGSAVHVLELHGYPEENKWTLDQIKGDVYPITKGTPRENATDAWIQWDIDTMIKSKSKIIGELAYPLPNDGGMSRQTALGKTVADIIRSKSKSHLAILRADALGAGLPEGAITDWDLIEAMPYPYKLFVVKLTGTQIEGLISKSQGKTGTSGYLQFSGLSQGGPDGIENLINGVPIDPMRNYTVTCSDFLVRGGGGYDELKDAHIVERIPMSTQEVCREAFADYGTLIIKNLPMERERNFWYKRCQIGISLAGLIANPSNEVLYPAEASVSVPQYFSSGCDVRLDVNRESFSSGFDNFIESSYSMTWDNKWNPTVNLDSINVGSQYTLYLSNIVFNGTKTFDPYVSTRMYNVMIYPDPQYYVTSSSATRPGSLYCAGGVVLAPFKSMTLKSGVRWQKQLFDWNQKAVTGLEEIFDFNIDILGNVLKIDNHVDVFYAFDHLGDNITVSSVNTITLNLWNAFQLAPQIKLFYNSLIGQLAYTLEIPFMFTTTFE